MNWNNWFLLVRKQWQTFYFVGKFYVGICTATHAILLQKLKLENFMCLPLQYTHHSYLCVVGEFANDDWVYEYWVGA